MKSLLASAYFLVAMYYRNKGNYTVGTLNYFRLTCRHSQSPKHWLAYARFQRDLQGTITPETLDRLQQMTEKKGPYQNKLQQFLLVVNSSNTPATLEHLPAALATIFAQQAQWRHELVNLLKGIDTISIVGNSTNLMAANQGHEIDKHDIVCRFNYFPQKTQSQSDIGTHTDIWIISSDVATNQTSRPADCHWIILAGPEPLATLQNWSWAEHYLNKGCKIVTLPIKYWVTLVSQFNAPPSSGVLWLHYLKSTTQKHATLHLFGFDKSISPVRYHITSALFKASSRHNWDAEKALLTEYTNLPNIIYQAPPTIAVFTKGLRDNPFLKQHLKTSVLIYRPNTNLKTLPQQVVGWGRKPNTRTAIHYAKQHLLPYYTLEDGFIHSMSQGRLGAHSWSLVKDALGIYYDSTQTSDLEQLINRRKLSEKERERAAECLNKIHAYQITKYNNGKLTLPAELATISDAILVIDQVDGDTSIPYAYADQDSFRKMMSAALAENPDIPILLKVHPDVINGKRKGCIDLKAVNKRIVLVSENINPVALLEVVRQVYVVSSQMGFEALLLGKKVVCFGVPFYSGWGLTDDRNSSLTTERRIAKPDLLTLFHCAYIDYSRYIHPETSHPCELEAVLDHVALQNHYYRQNTGTILCLGFTPWKKSFIKHFLRSNDNIIHFVKDLKQAQKLTIDDQTQVFIWSFRMERQARELQSNFGCNVTKIEDGFIRSIGLGVNYTLPSSLAFDDEGIYFDPSEPSALEKTLSDMFFDRKLTTKSRKVIDRIIEKEISKYNQVESNTRLDELSFTKHPVILVPGQVADDASVLCGCPKIADNLELLKVVRERNPKAIIIYKPHPDVVSGHREGAINRDTTFLYCDHIIDDTPISDCLNAVDEVHTMTSLVGFEALLRGLKVHCYGIPFYAGWGLTTDQHTVKRRTRTLKIEELVAGSLLLYPRYYNWQTGCFSHIETIIESLSEQPNERRRLKKSLRLLPSPLRKVIEIAIAMIKAR